ncbi:MAG: YggS family pyridoxal phosphate-dependent enzyme [Ilumatobacteraceae bacterium]|nr:YggS family pyridoxal phosphate-dependent enzyme [Ilumatobacteraceae bacterium]
MTSIDASQVSLRATEIRQRINAAGGKDVKLIAVTKTFDVGAMVAAFDAGCDGVGENYAQELIAKSGELPIEKHLPVHFIGRLQSNKIKLMAESVDVWQSVDRVELINEIAKRCAKAGSNTRPQIMLQVNATDEPDKGGCKPLEVTNLLDAANVNGLEVLGLMTVGPTSNEVQSTQRSFRLVRKLVDDLGLKQCSMGMTGDLEIAIAEGSTMIRVGSALFGPRR